MSLSLLYTNLCFVYMFFDAVPTPSPAIPCTMINSTSLIVLTSTQYISSMTRYSGDLYCIPSRTRLVCGTAHHIFVYPHASDAGRCILLWWATDGLWFFPLSTRRPVMTCCPYMYVSFRLLTNSKICLIPSVYWFPCV